MSKVKSARLFLTNFLNIIRSSDLFPLGGQITYYAVLSFFPLLLSALNILSYFSLSTDVITRLSSLFPHNFSDTITNIIEDMVRQRNVAVISISTLTTIWAASRGIEAILRGLHRIYQTPLHNPLKLKALAVIFYFFLIAALIFSFLSGVMGESIAQYLFASFGPDHITGFLWQYIRHFLELLLLAAVFLMLNKFVTGRHYPLRHLIPGVLLSAGGWIVLSLGFSTYVSFANTYSVIYGSLAGIMLLLLWLYWAAAILLFGAVLNVALNDSYEPTELIPPYDS
ncbi:MAG: YihY/virulence factor BrkB family protein [Peptococcaceae bacterium]|nr:YihY/virulence factor BrkB family protein [Peptococcaceae bacterium]